MPRTLQQDTGCDARSARQQAILAATFFLLTHGRAPRALIADGDAVTRERMRLALSQRGFLVAIASHAEATCRVLGQRTDELPVDVLFIARPLAAALDGRLGGWARSGITVAVTHALTVEAGAPAALDRVLVRVCQGHAAPSPSGAETLESSASRTRVA
jgi:hypothetical protein